MKESPKILRKAYHVRQLALLPFLVALTLFLHYYVAQSPHIPFWLESLGSLLGCCLGGMWYGLAVAICAGLIESVISSSLFTFLSSLVLISVTMALGVIISMGFFWRWRHVPLAALFCAFLSAAVRTPISLALSGGISTSNSLIIWLFALLSDHGFSVVSASALSFLITDYLDKFVVLLICFAVMRIMPERFSTLFCIHRDFPHGVIVADTVDSEFSGELDKLKERAQARLDEKKKTADPSDDAVAATTAAAPAPETPPDEKGAHA